jgi:hypothetical protein
MGSGLLGGVSIRGEFCVARAAFWRNCVLVGRAALKKNFFEVNVERNCVELA